MANEVHSVYNLGMTETLHIYTRVSTTAQEDDGTSLDTQKDLGIDRATKLGMKFRIWNEGSRSSSNDDLANRPVLSELLLHIEDGAVKHLYVWNTDRLSRNMETWAHIRARLLKNDVHLHTPNGEQDLSDLQSNLMLGIMSEFSQYDNLLRAERFRLGKLQKIRKGGWKGGPPPFGYSLANSQLEINPVESKWVVYIYESYRSGLSVSDIRQGLMENGVLTRRGNAIWSHGSIEKVLQNTHYDGYWWYTDKKSEESVRVPCPRVCDPQLIEGVRKAREKRVYRKPGNRRGKTGVSKYEYLLAGLLKCGSCGSFYYGNFRPGRVSYYHCGQKTNKFRDKDTEREVDCRSIRNIRIDTTERLVWGLVKDVIQSSHLFRETIKEEVLGGPRTYAKTKEEKKTIGRQIKKLEREVETITNSLVNLAAENILSKSRDSKRFIKKLEDNRNEREAQIKQLTSDLQDIETGHRWVDWLKAFKDRIDTLDQLTFEEKRQFLVGVVSEVIVNEIDKQSHRLDVIFQFPYVCDDLIRNDPTDLSKGYSIKEGKTVKSEKCDLRKKFTAR